MTSKSRQAKPQQSKNADAATKVNSTKTTKTKPAAVKRASATSAASKPAPPVKAKRIRGSFSMPEADYALIPQLKSASKASGRPVKKNELLRAGLHALKAMPEAAFQSALSVLATSMPAKPRKSKSN